MNAYNFFTKTKAVEARETLIRQIVNSGVENVTLKELENVSDEELADERDEETDVVARCEYFLSQGRDEAIENLRSEIKALRKRKNRPLREPIRRRRGEAAHGSPPHFS